MYFYKYHGTGNDFVVIDDRDGFLDLSPVEVRKICHRHFGIGADGVILLREAGSHDYEMVYFNADGHPGSMCGNGARCAFHCARSLGIVDDEAKFKAYDGAHRAQLLSDGRIAVTMQNVRGISMDGEASVLDTGSPHYVLFVEGIEAIDVRQRGRAIRYSDAYKADGINVNFIEIGEGILKVRTYERGVEEETMSCGTGATASALAYARRAGLAEGPVLVQVPGGQLEVSFRDKGKAFKHIKLTGPVQRVFEGDWQLGED